MKVSYLILVLFKLLLFVQLKAADRQTDSTELISTDVTTFPPETTVKKRDAVVKQTVKATGKEAYTTNKTANQKPIRLSKCPLNCGCIDQVVTCEMTSLSQLPSSTELPAKVQQLNLMHNKMQRLAVGDLMPDLQVLILSYNQIDDVESDALAKFPNLIELNLSFNRLEQLPEDMFVNQSRLQRLHLQQNRLKILPDKIFVPLIQLKELDLSGNKLRYAFDTWFRNQSQLKRLDLSACELSELPHAMFYRTERLEQLLLTDNHFDRVPLLESAANLKYLNLDRNPLKRVEQSSFENLLNLRELQLNHCPELTDVDAFSFTDLRSLKRLSMSRNKHLVYIDRLAFEGLFNQTDVSLEELIINENLLTSIDERTLPFEKLKLLDLRANPLFCDCAMGWARMLIDKFEYVRMAR